MGHCLACVAVEQRSDLRRGFIQRQPELRGYSTQFRLLEVKLLLGKKRRARGPYKDRPFWKSVLSLAQSGLQPGAVEHQNLVADLQPLNLAAELNEVFEPWSGYSESFGHRRQQLALDRGPDDNPHRPLRPGQQAHQIG